ncbi:uncharacterized protein LOC112201706 [Rosa chinensis]|uniref:uncharacterized protein LOC112201706 n=1 Tax=Rosa chinensis TaxID=74649 RepID=UPI000D08805D|nr:uncharacterized protein LOC112201706 [Rosa chinensis]
MVGKLLTAREYSRHSFLGMFRSAWRINGRLSVEEVGEDDRVLFTFTDPSDVDRVWKGGPWGYNRAPVALAPYNGISPASEIPLKKSSYWMTLQGVPPAFRSERIMHPIGSTLGDFKEFDRPTFQTRVLRIRVKIDYAKPLLFCRRFWVEDEVQFMVQFRYDKLFGRCGTCGLVTHVGLPCLGPDLEEDSDTPVGAVAQPTALAMLPGQENPNNNRVVVNNQTLIFKAQIPNSIPKALKGSTSSSSTPHSLRATN